MGAPFPEFRLKAKICEKMVRSDVSACAKVMHCALWTQCDAMCSSVAEHIDPNKKALLLQCFFVWRRHPESDRGIADLQSAALPLGYGAI